MEENSKKFENRQSQQQELEYDKILVIHIFSDTVS